MNDSVQKETEAKGTSVCRYCGKNTPHRHDFDRGRAAISAALDMQLLDRPDSEAAADYLRTFAPPYPQISPAFSNTPGVPDGWKLVPVEPTAHMLVEGAAAQYGYEKNSSQIEYDRLESRLVCYRAMLAASPSIPVGHGAPFSRRVDKEQAQRIISHVNDRCSKSNLASPSINISRDGWQMIVQLLEDACTSQS